MYKRNAPHYELPGSFYFITFRTINKFSLNEQSKNIIFDAIKFHDNRKYKIYSFVIMPDHAHLICQPLEKSPHGFYSLEEISHSLKSFSAKEINKILGREGTLWQNERFDRLIRDEDELKEKIDYIIKNPVKAELVKAPEDYRWLYYIDWRI
jgi:REP element-mobilizing transposase RayT